MSLLYIYIFKHTYINTVLIVYSEWWDYRLPLFYALYFCHICHIVTMSQHIVAVLPLTM